MFSFMLGRVFADHWFQYFIAKFHQYIEGKDWFYVLNSTFLMILNFLIIDTFLYAAKVSLCLLTMF